MDTNGHQSPERTRDDFRDFTFANAVRLWGSGNPSFFEGAAVADAAAALLAETPAGVGR
jgi:hypothetical protein